MRARLAVTVIVLITAIVQFSFRGAAPSDEIELGRELFFDPILSGNQTISCATCHIPAFAFSDTVAVSIGIAGQRGTRNTPSAMNINLQRSFFWDGRARTIEDQVLMPIANPAEMDLPIPVAVQRLKEDRKYAADFQRVFQSAPDSVLLASAIAAFLRTLETSDSPYDEWKFSDRPAAVSESVKRGFAVFNGKGKCIQCHFGPDFNANDFRNIGLFDGAKFNDSGRFDVTRNPADIGRFKIGPLRNIAVTAPYMHNGIFGTLKEVIDFYDDPSKVVPRGQNRDTVLRSPLGLTELEKLDLEEFLRSLTDKRFAQKR